MNGLPGAFCYDDSLIIAEKNRAMAKLYDELARKDRAIGELNDHVKEQADEAERLKILAVKAWHAARSSCLVMHLTNPEIEELVAMANKQKHDTLTARPEVIDG